MRQSCEQSSFERQLRGAIRLKTGDSLLELDASVNLLNPAFLAGRVGAICKSRHLQAFQQIPHHRLATDFAYNVTGRVEYRGFLGQIMCSFAYFFSRVAFFIHFIFCLSKLCRPNHKSRSVYFFGIFIQPIQSRRLINSIIRSMGIGCCISAPPILQKIMDPFGEPQDPLHTSGDILNNIAADPHLHYFQSKIETIMTPTGTSPMRHLTKPQVAFATTDKEEYKSYIDYINSALSGNDLSATNVLSYLFKEVADLREKTEVQLKFKHQKFAALKCFIYLYTGDYAYKKVNQFLRANQYQRLAPVMGVIKKELQQFSKENSSLFDKKISVLYRSIDHSDALMAEKSQIYWKSFTSTSLSKDVTNRFGRYQYTIYLKKGNLHDLLVIPKELSRYDEEEVLLFPYFCLMVSKVQSFKANKSENYEVVQVDPEAEKVNEIGK